MRFCGEMDDDGVWKRVEIEIGEPIPTPGESDHFCTVIVPRLPRPIRIFGESPEQARSLAMRFVCRLYDGVSFRDEEGRAVRMEEILVSG